MLFIFAICIVLKIEPGADASTSTGAGKKQESIAWAKDDYSLIKPTTGCPKDFKETSLSLSGLTNIKVTATKDITVEVKETEKAAIISLCTQSKAATNPTFLPSGSYCVIKVGEIGCHTDFTTTDIKITASLTLSFCCRKASDQVAEIVLPGDTPFTLIKSQAKCPNVKGLNVTEGNIKIEDTNNPAVLAIVATSDKFTTTVTDITNPAGKSIDLKICLYNKPEESKGKAEASTSNKGMIIGCAVGAVVLIILIVVGVIIAKKGK